MVDGEVNVNAEDNVLWKKTHQPEYRRRSIQRAPLRPENLGSRGKSDTGDAVCRADAERKGCGKAPFDVL